MSVRQLLFAQSIILLITAFLYFLGFFLYLHWVFWWYDIVLHFLGGAWAALAVMWSFAMYKIPPRWAHVISLVIIIGVLWEIFEFVIGAPRESNYRPDTSLDLLMDVAGSFAAMYFVRRKTALFSAANVDVHE
ncbi:MAG: hypothetical protein G01um10148_689 [Parcubacteria group bacterium Gr01-1014_8]|nr:MAG: hypothetical protein G01um10148_689 [Parcubacteria group bacterium Gr01-1014_8]